MTKYWELGLYVIASLLMTKTPTAQTQKAKSPRPNLVFIMSDQHSYDMVGWHPGSQALTPHLNRLASGGVVFNHAIANNPQCTPYRSILLSGRHTIRNGAINNDVRMLSSDEAGQPGTYLAEVLEGNGYRTGYVGKWHLYGGDRERPIPEGPYRYGFNGFFLSNNCTLEFEANKAYWWDSAGNKKIHDDWEPFGQSRHAADFIRRQGKNPFALFIAYHPPHDFGGNKYQAPDKYMAMYDEHDIKLRDNAIDDPNNKKRYRGHLAMISGIDDAIGMVVQVLEEKGMMDNTVIAFTSDHGDMLFSHRWPNNKGRPENESIHVPLMIRWPAKLNAGRSDILLSTIDLMPTLLGILGIPQPTACQGKNLSKDIVRRGKGPYKRVPIYNHQHNWRGVYSKRYTFSFCTDPDNEPETLSNSDTVFPRFLLYDRKKDPWEKQNRINDPSYAKIKRKLSRATSSWMKGTDDVDMPYQNISRVIRHHTHPQDLPWPSVGGLLKGVPSELLKNKKIPTDQQQ